MRYNFPWKRENLSEIWTWPHLRMLNIGGWWAEEASTPKLKKILSFWRIISSISATISTTSLLTYIVKEFAKGEFEKALFLIFVFTSLFQGSFNMYYLVKYRTSLRHAMILLDELTRSLQHPEDIVIVREKLTGIWIIFVATLIIIIMGTIHWISRPIFYASLYEERSEIIYDNWSFFNKTWTVFIITYIFEAFNVFLLASVFILFNSIFISIAEYVLCHFIVLQNKFQRLCISTTQETVELKNIISSHAKLLKVCENLRLSSEEIIMTETILVVAAFCLLLFTITMEKEISFTVILNMLEVTLSFTINFGLLCWYSHELTQNCENFGSVAYLSDWTSGCENHKKILLILMTRTVLPIKYGGFINITLNTIITVLKATFSYYNFLIAIMDEK